MSRKAKRGSSSLDEEESDSNNTSDSMREFYAKLTHNANRTVDEIINAADRNENTSSDGSLAAPRRLSQENASGGYAVLDELTHEFGELSPAKEGAKGGTCSKRHANSTPSRGLRRRKNEKTRFGMCAGNTTLLWEPIPLELDIGRTHLVPVQL